MRIAVITSGILPVPAVQGGAVENLIDFYLEYNERHRLHDITVYSAWHRDVEQHASLQSEVNHYVYVKTHSLWFRLCAKLYGKLHRDSYYFYQLEYFLEQVFRRMRRQHYDLIVLENRPAAAIKLRRQCTTPIIAHIHTNLIHPETPRKEEILRATDQFLVVSDYIRQQIASIGTPVKIQVLYNGLDEQQFHRQGDTSVSRESLGLHANDFVVIYTGRIVPKKGVKELVQAIQQLDSHPDIKLLVVGGDNFGDSVSSNPYLDELHQMGNDMQGRVVFTGFVPYELLPAYLHLADVAVVPSRIDEAFGMTCVEATAMGLPVIATNDGGIPETLVGQKHILIDRDGDRPTDIAHALLHVKDNYKDFTGNTLSPRFTKETYAKTFFEAINQYGI